MIKVYKDAAAGSIVLEDNNGAQFLNSLQAIINVDDANNIDIQDNSKNIKLVYDNPHDEFIDFDDNVYPGTVAQVVNTLNALFQTSGTPTGELPEITSSLTASITTGATLNYELIADYGVGYEWDLSSVPGVTTVEGNVRKLVGGTGLAAGTYNIPVKAINYNGEDSQTLVLTVANPPYNNTKSVFFRQNDYCEMTASTSSPFYRTGNNTGNAFKVAFWFKPSTSNNQNQTVVSFGGNDLANEGRVLIGYNGNNLNAGRRRMRFFYGTNNNNLQFYTPSGSTQAGVWAHWVFLYDGGTTENGSGGINTSYSRFKIYKNAVLQTLTTSNNNYGFSGQIPAEIYRMGRLLNSGQYLRNCNIDEYAVFDNASTTDIASIYNSGTPSDLGLLSTPSIQYLRMGDANDVFPDLYDYEGSNDAEMINMTSADIVSDVP